MRAELHNISHSNAKNGSDIDLFSFSKSAYSFSTDSLGLLKGCQLMLQVAKLSFAFSLVLLVCLSCGDPIADSHIKANAPVSSQFSAVMSRDLQSYFQASRVDFQLLREGPTQTGVSYPKYYLWVKVFDSSGQSNIEGAARVAAIDQVRIEVTHFLTAKEIRSNPSAVEQVFPQPLVESVLSHASAAQ